MLKGSCLCGGIRYEIDAELTAVSNCHCRQCRKASGAAFGTGATIPTASFRFIAGEELLEAWESSPGKRRCFCRRCGSPILKRNDARPEALRLRLGTLELAVAGPMGTVHKERTWRGDRDRVRRLA